MENRCEFCEKPLSEEKLEHLHGCLDCAGMIYLNQRCDKYICVHCIENENEKLKKGLDSCGIEIDRYMGERDKLKAENERLHKPLVIRDEDGFYSVSVKLSTTAEMERDKLAEQVKVLKEALEFYATMRHPVYQGKAREALKKVSDD